MKRDVIAIVAKQLESIQQDHAFALREVELAREKLDEKLTLLSRVGQHLNDIEEMHNAITPT